MCDHLAVAGAPLDRLREVLRAHSPRIVACSGGVDSLLLATVAHRADPERTIVAHAVTPAVPGGATARVAAEAQREGFRLELVATSEFEDPEYLANPIDRCYHCKSHLYAALDLLGRRLDVPQSWQLFSGANCDDLAEYRPGLRAASEHHVAHPYIDAGIDKAGVRAIARQLGVGYADLPASPCLASRLYTGTRVTVDRLRAVDAGEELIRRLAGIDVVRCRSRDDEIVVEVTEGARHKIDDSILACVLATVQAIDPRLRRASLDERPYKPGRAFTEIS